MKKPELKKWQKILLSAMSGTVVASTAIAVPAIMTSCSKAPIYIDEIDREFNVSSATYKKMKDDLRSIYKLNLEKVHTPEEEKNQKLVKLDQDIQKLDEIFETSDTENSDKQIFDFTTRTSQLSDMAFEDYNIQLDRTSSASWQDLRDEYRSFRDSNEIYMHSIPLDYQIIQMVLKNADLKFEQTITDLQDRYKNDALAGLLHGRPKLFECFDSVNFDIAALAASERLSDFLSKFTFVAKDDPSQANRYDKVESKLVVNQVIKPELMRLMFNCVEAKSGTIWDYDPYELVPGYYIEPVLHEKIPNPFENTYEISIDWSLINVNYLSPEFTPEQQELVTGHVYAGNPDCEGATDIAQMLHESDRIYSNYSLYPTAAYETVQLKDAYFSEKAARGCINFKWEGGAENPDNKYEEFFTGVKDDEDTGTLSFDTLGRSGLLISSNTQSYEKVSDVIKRVKQNSDTDPKILPLVDRFVRNCDLTSTVTIVNDDNHEITNELKATYNNTVNKTAGHKLPKYQNNGYNVSPEFFEHVNRCFDEAKKWVEIYRYNEFEKATNQAEKYILTMAASSVQTVGYTAYYVYRMMFPQPGHGDPATNAMMIGECAGETALLGAWIAFMTLRMYKPTKRLADQCDELNHMASYKGMLDKIEQDSKYFAELNDDGTPVSQSEYNTKYKDFAKYSFRGIERPLFQFYSTFRYQSLTIEFTDLTKKYIVDAETVSGIMSPWIYLNGWCNLASIAWAGAQTILESFLVTVLYNKAFAWDIRSTIAVVQFLLNQLVYGIIWVIGNCMRWCITGRW